MLGHRKTAEMYRAAHYGRGRELFEAGAGDGRKMDARDARWTQDGRARKSGFGAFRSTYVESSRADSDSVVPP